MSSKDRVYEKRVANKRRREDEEERRRTNARNPGPSTVNEDEATEETSMDLGEEEDHQREFTIRSKKSDTVTIHLPRKILKSQAVCQMADRLLLSSNQVVGVISSVLRSAVPPANLDDFSLSRETTRRARRRVRYTVGQEEEKNFNAPEHVVVHWDGKILKNALDLPEHRQAILVSGAGCEAGKILAVPTLKDGTGLEQAQATISALEEWSIEDRVRGLCFDTTASNTGRLQGAMVRVEAALGRRLLRLACRHHVLELVVGAVATCLFGRTTGPSNVQFEELKTRWSTLDLKSPVKKLLFESRWEQEQRETSAQSLRAALQESIPRDDYREAGQLGLVLLGETSVEGIKWQRPGAMHNARWMAKVIYYSKMYLLQDQLQYGTEQEKALESMARFLALIYIPAWMNASSAADAPQNDALLYNQLMKYREVDGEVAHAALKVIRRHPWYLAPETVVLSLCSSGFEDVKSKIGEKLASTPRPGNFEVGSNQVVVLDEIEPVNLPDMVNEDSWLIFEMLGLTGDWLCSPPHEWSQSEEFTKLKMFVSSLKVVNDTAERGIRLVEQFCNTLTKNETDLQWLLKTVESHRKKYPTFSKKTLAMQ